MQPRIRWRILLPSGPDAGQGNSRRNEKGKKGKNAIPGVFGGHNAHRTEPERWGEVAACPSPLVVSQLGVYSRTGGLTSVGSVQRQVEAQFDSLRIAICQASHLGGLARF